MKEGKKCPFGKTTACRRKTSRQQTKVPASKQSAFRRSEGRGSQSGGRRPKTRQHRPLQQAEQHTSQRESTRRHQPPAPPEVRECRARIGCHRLDTAPANSTPAIDISTNRTEQACGSGDASSNENAVDPRHPMLSKSSASDAAACVLVRRSPRRIAEPASKGLHQCETTAKTSVLPPVINLPIRLTIREDGRVYWIFFVVAMRFCRPFRTFPKPGLLIAIPRR
jgi:hypothetical protein